MVLIPRYLDQMIPMSVYSTFSVGFRLSLWHSSWRYGWIRPRRCFKRLFSRYHHAYFPQADPSITAYMNIMNDIRRAVKINFRTFSSFNTYTSNATTLSSSPNTDGKNRNLAYTFDCILDPLSPLHRSNKIRKNLVGSGGKLGLRITRDRIVATSGMGFKVDHQYNKWDGSDGC